MPGKLSVDTGTTPAAQPMRLVRLELVVTRLAAGVRLEPLATRLAHEYTNG
jgi:hypothetical protein